MADRPDIERSGAVDHPAVVHGVEKVQRPLTGRRSREFSFFGFFFLDRNLVAAADCLSLARGRLVGSVIVGRFRLQKTTHLVRTAGARNLNGRFLSPAERSLLAPFAIRAHSLGVDISVRCRRLCARDSAQEYLFM